MHDLKQIWQGVLGQIELKFNPSIVNTWFSKTKLERLDNDTAIISCQSPYTLDILQKRYREAISSCLEQLTEDKYQPKFTLRKEDSADAEGPLFDELPGELKPGSRSRTSRSKPQHNVNPQYTFDNFVVGNCNRVAHAAAMAATDDPGSAYNPLFIYGGSGMGKTHLLYAIGNRLKIKEGMEKILYFPVETFINDFVEAIRFKKTNQFKKKYRQNDCLLIDDIQFIGGDKTAIQEEFFHTFNELYNRSKQIVICSDRPPSEIDQLTRRLVTRFAGGLMVEITPPEFETRMAIVQTKAADLDLNINTETADFIAQYAGNSVRELEGLLLKLRSEMLVKELPVNLGTVKSVLSNNSTPQEKPKRLTPEIIFQLINSHFETNMAQLCGRKRKREIVIPRQIAMYLLRNDLGLNLEHIGQLLGGRDHTTVMHGVEKISQKLKKKETSISVPVRQIRQQLY